jgi:putative spermidine/putrescine transport system ATP-binding protein
VSASLHLQGLGLSYRHGNGSVPVIRDLSLDIVPGECVALLGPSGCGKTTILKLVAGLLPLDRGRVVIDDVDVTGLAPELRRTAMVFQRPLLFPYLPVRENVAFSLKLRREAPNTIRERVGEALAMVKLEGFGERMPEQLSGGQQQRVSLARALVSDPRILLLDEPFTALDENLRSEMRSLVRTIQRNLSITTVLVTHDRNEAASVAHGIAFLHQGRIEQVGTLRDFYEQPASLDSARFFGWQVVKGSVDQGQLTTGLGVFEAIPASGPVWAAFRPEAASVSSDDNERSAVESSVDLGTRALSTVRLSTGECIEVMHDLPVFEAGQGVRVAIRPGAILTFPRS